MTGSNFSRWILVALTLAMTAGVANADDSVRKQQLTAAQGLQTKALEFNEAFGTRVTANIDWNSFKGSRWTKHSMPSYCGAVFSALTSLATGKSAKSYVKLNFTRLECKHARKSSVAVQGKTITVYVTFGKSMEELARTELMRKF
jgi:hypothetical protein